MRGQLPDTAFRLDVPELFELGFRHRLVTLRINGGENLLRGFLCQFLLFCH